MDYQRHGLTRDMKRRVFDALLEMQDGRCFICGFQAELNLYPDNPQWMRNSNICYQLYIDHSHINGMIRGLLCQPCNTMLGFVENDGLFQYYSAPAFKNEPWYVSEALYSRLQEGDAFLRRWEAWLDQHRGILLLYMQRERWFPRKDILFHLQARQ